MDPVRFYTSRGRLDPAACQAAERFRREWDRVQASAIRTVLPSTSGIVGPRRQPDGPVPAPDLPALLARLQRPHAEILQLVVGWEIYPRRAAELIGRAAACGPALLVSALAALAAAYGSSAGASPG